jgi:hypothetical protein
MRIIFGINISIYEIIGRKRFKQAGDVYNTIR